MECSAKNVMIKEFLCEKNRVGGAAMGTGAPTLVPNFAKNCPILPKREGGGKSTTNFQNKIS